ncbi:unnamed protein product [Hyaloperonospora brassicae]|uniref:PX domain-containing protein n=1 Tax=Hyaloperonospora brassicae TaxID=162125 RepID=A0AAV0UNQ1_HYABA|nr:unnamed protein product [Hyaloperonospora brassicae]
MSRLVVAIGHVEFTGSSHVLYVVNVQQDVDAWQVRRTYSDFRKLRDDVQRVMRDDESRRDSSARTFARALQDVAFPSKRLFGSKKDHVVKERAVELHRFLMKLLVLTHTFRKAQKERGEQVDDNDLADRLPTSVAVFHLLRDFLKPVTMAVDPCALVLPSNGSSSSSCRSSSAKTTTRDDGPMNWTARGASGTSSGHRHAAIDGREPLSTTRVIRESKILGLRSSLSSNKSSGRRGDERCEELLLPTAGGDHSDGAGQEARERLEDTVAQSERGTSCSATGGAKAGRALPERLRADVGSLLRGRVPKTAPSALTGASKSEQLCSTFDGSLDEWKSSIARAASSMPHSAGSSVHDEPEPEKERATASSSRPLSASCATFVDGRRGKDLSTSSSSTSSSSSFVCHTNKCSRRGNDVFHSFQEARSTDRSFVVHSREKLRSSRPKRKALSTKCIQLTDSERMSRVSSALNAQAISIHAQRELEKYLSEYSAIMILRYLDRFINKAVMKAPGCYSVDAEYRLVIDSQRFLEELEVKFADLPSNFGEMFRVRVAVDSQKEWGFPLALDKYVQLKWDSFQAMNSSNSIASLDNGHSSAADHTSDSEDSDTEYEYEEVGGGGGGGGSGYMRAKHTFSNDEESMLQEMIDNGTAGRDQMLRLRRQTNEQGWNWRGKSGSRSQRVTEQGSSSSESEDGGDTKAQQREKRRLKRRDPTRSGPCEVEKYQQEQNARRKDRLSRVQSIGGFV